MKEWMGHVGAMLVVAVWGTTFVSSKVLIGFGLTPADIFSYRFLLAYMCLVAVSHRRMWSACYSLLMLGLVASTGGFLVWNRVMKVLGAVRVTNYVYFQSLLTMTVGAVVLHERVTWMALLGCMVLIGGMLVALNSGKKAKAAQATT